MPQPPRSIIGLCLRPGEASDKAVNQVISLANARELPAAVVHCYDGIVSVAALQHLEAGLAMRHLPLMVLIGPPEAVLPGLSHHARPLFVPFGDAACAIIKALELAVVDEWPSAASAVLAHPWPGVLLSVSQLQSQNLLSQLTACRE